MRFPVRVFLRCISSILIFFLLLQFFASNVLAQTQQIPNPQQQSYTRPNVEENVPLNQHTYVQAMFLELMIAIQCQLTGIDMANPGNSCLGINLQTGKLGYAPMDPSQNGPLPISGVMGMLNSGISTMYTPAFGTQDYIRYVAGDFGLVKSAYAQYTGFEGLSPILGLWKATRDIAYYLLIIAFIFIGIGVMLRLKIDPRTVMTVQNQIPRVIICIILITFSYAIAGLLIDTMWAVTYMGVNKITEAGTGIDPTLDDCNGDPLTLGEAANTKILQTPFSFVNTIFKSFGCNTSGVVDLSNHVSFAISAIELNLILEALGAQDGCDVSGTGALKGGLAGVIFGPIGVGIGSLIGASENAGTCFIAQALVSIFGYFVLMMWWIIVTVIIIITLFRIWFELLKAYVMVILYVILGPLWIVFGLLPKKPLGFEKWLRVYFAHLAVFPATVFLLVGARVLGDLFNQNPSATFIPPLIGNPATGYLGAIIEFGMLLMTPTLVGLLREKLGVPPTKQFQQAVQTFNAGRQAPGAVAKKAWSGLYRHNPTTGAPESALALGVSRVTNAMKRGVIGQGGILGYKPESGKKERWWQRAGRQWVERGENRERGRGFVTNNQYYGEDSSHNPNVQARIARERQAAQQQLAPLLGTPGAQVRPSYTSDEWKTLHQHEQHMTDEQRQRLAGSLLRKPHALRSDDEKEFLETQMRRGDIFSTAQRQQYEDDLRQARAGQQGGQTQGGTTQPTHVIITVQPTGGGTPQTIHATLGQTVRQVVMSRATGDPTSQQLVETHLRQRFGPDIDTPVEQLTQQRQTDLGDFIGARVGTGGPLTLQPRPTGTGTPTTS